MFHPELFTGQCSWLIKYFIIDYIIKNWGMLKGKINKLINYMRSHERCSSSPREKKETLTDKESTSRHVDKNVSREKNVMMH